ncbi:MAG TPA: sodium:proton antiporter [Xanthobacteraceae bacterium]|nr:sodium:proton antiporter [Xanthobacteraceae bacterium]
MQPADIIAIVLVLGAVIGCLNSLYFRLPPAIGVLFGSLVLSALIVTTDRLFSLHALGWFRSTLDSANLPHLFLDGTLALLLFAGSLHVDFAALHKRRWMIVLLATASVIISMVVFGFGMRGIFWLVGADVPLVWCFVLGAVLAPTDAIVVATLLKRVNLPESLRAAIVGESLFNDGAAVVLFLVALRVAHGEPIVIGEGHIAWALAREILGGVGIGIAFAWIAVRAIRAIKDDGLRLLIELALALAAYRVANVADMSGPIAVVTAGMWVGNALQRATPGGDIRPALVAFWTLLDQLLNTMLFLLIGFQVLGLTFQISHLLQVVLAIPLAIAARMVSVALPLAFARGSLRAKSHEAAVLTWAGLRGGISVALALTLPASPWRADLLVICYAVVVFTIVVQGLSLPAVLRKIYGATAVEPAPAPQAHPGEPRP